MNKITFESWDNDCADGCCHDWGEKLYVNGNLITNRVMTDITELTDILTALEIEFEIEETVEGE